jgi:two-component system sensor histidine kinase DesK
MARDLHDLLGHTLSLFTLKSELAGRLITTAPARAAEEIQEVERVARQTLREVREAVAGYRQPALHSELDGAQQLLEAAGIAWTIENTTGELPPATDVVLAWTIREGVTNVIRHNHARWCGIRVTAANDTACVEVTNDSAPRQDMEGTHQRIGSGLAGLTERVRAAGGQIAAGPFTRGDTAIFRLWVEIPLHSHGAVAQERES